MKRVAVIGSGIAGTAAALAARMLSDDVVVVMGGTGATVLAPGALDDQPWEGSPASVHPLGPIEREVLSLLDAYTLPEAGAVVATTAGTLRPARGLDRALLDLGALEKTTVLVPNVAHGTWDAAVLCRGWNDSAIAKDRQLAFTCVPAHLTRFVDEYALVDADMALRHDDADRRAWLAEQLRVAVQRSGVRAGAFLLPAWLGVETSRSQELSSGVGVPCGEVTSSPGGPSGLRFERARGRAFDKAQVRLVTAWSTGVSKAGSGQWSVTLESGPDIPVDSVVLAMGGLVGGGLYYAAREGALLRLSIQAPASIGAFGHPIEPPSSPFGAATETNAWPFQDEPLLDRAGVCAAPDGHAVGAGPGLFACGELVADRPRTWLEALSSGATAGRAAAS